MDADLHSIIKSNQNLTIQHIQWFVYQLLKALKCIHSANVMHRDLVRDFPSQKSNPQSTNPNCSSIIIRNPEIFY